MKFMTIFKADQSEFEKWTSTWIVEYVDAYRCAKNVNPTLTWTEYLEYIQKKIAADRLKQSN